MGHGKPYPRLYLGLAALMAGGLVYRLGFEFYRLLFSDKENAAIDLWQRFDEVQGWFAGKPIYDIYNAAVYPPASYAMMWPFMGLPSIQAVRWLWAVSSALLLAYIIRALVQQEHFKSTREKAFWALFILAHYATGITLGNGQLTLHIMAAVLASVALLNRDESRWTNAGLVGLFALLALVKPTTGAPFIWLVLFIPRSVYPFLVTVAGYVLVTLVGSWFQPTGIIQLHRDWVVLGMQGAAWSSDSANFVAGARDAGYGNIHSLLAFWDVSGVAPYVSLAMLALLGVWVYLYRRCNRWVLLGVAAVFSRVWTYHRVYDDMIILFAIFAVIAILKLEMNPRLQRTGRWLLALLFIASLAPASLRLLPAPLGLAYTLGQPALWMATLGYLAHTAHIEKQSSKAAGPA